MSSYQDLDIQEVKRAQSPKVNLFFLVKILIFLAFVSYLYSLFYGESSVSVLLDAKNREAKLMQEYNNIQNENQKLQKKHFELIQLTPDEETLK